MTRTDTEWVEYNRWNRRDERLAALWVEDLVAYLRAEPRVRGGAVLDYGCGYLDAGLAIADLAARVDGFDPDAETVTATRRRVSQQANVHLFTDADALPTATYDLIVVNSVFQYLADDAHLTQTLAKLRTLLKPEGEIVVSDLIPRRYSAPRDAVRSLVTALPRGLAAPMLVHLAKAAKGGGKALLQIDPEAFAALAARAGLRFTPLGRNLTPSRQRYAGRLRPA